MLYVIRGGIKNRSMTKKSQMFGFLCVVDHSASSLFGLAVGIYKYYTYRLYRMCATCAEECSVQRKYMWYTFFHHKGGISSSFVVIRLFLIFDACMICICSSFVQVVGDQTYDLSAWEIVALIVIGECSNMFKPLTCQ